LLARSSGYSSGNWTNHNFYFADGNGNVTYLINGSQTMVASYRYDPFGNLISSSGPLWALNRYRFSSKEIHVGSGMYYYGYRFYDPNLQRWINRDPLGSYPFRPAMSSRIRRISDATVPARRHRRSELAAAPDPHGVMAPSEGWRSANLYVFTLNSPIAQHDPTGLMTQQQIQLNLEEAGDANDFEGMAYWRAEMDAYAENAAAIANGDAAALQAEAATAEAAAAAETALPLWVECTAAGWAAATGYAIGTAAANAPVVGGGTVSDWWGDTLGDLCPSCWSWVFW
jgi:RHS repeat-associated protein